MNLSIVIPNYNGENLLKKNLSKVADVLSLYKNGKVEIIVADDCSTDDSIKIFKELNIKLKTQYPDMSFRILESERNLGFSSNVNKGVTGAKGEIVILLNTDVYPKKNFLTPLLAHFSDSNVFAVGCMDESIEQGKVILRGRGVGQWKRGLLIHSRGEVDKENTLWIAGGSGAFRRSTWEKIGGFNELYNPFYWEDIDLSYRALKNGYKIIFETKSVVIHEHEKGAIKSTYSDFKISSTAYRNQFIFIWKNITDSSMKLSHLLWFPYHIFSALLRGDLAFVKGILDAFILLPKIIKYSSIERKFFVLKDNQLLAPFKGEK